MDTPIKPVADVPLPDRLKVLDLAKALDPNAWLPIAFTMTDANKRRLMAERRLVSLTKARNHVAEKTTGQKPKQVALGKTEVSVVIRTKEGIRG